MVIMDLATRDVKQISSLELTSETNLAWSPDGKYIAVTLGALYVIDVETQLTRQLSVDNISAQSPSWSPDSSRIAFSANSDVYVVYADGHDIRKLSTPQFSTYSHQPQWSFVNNEVLFLTSHDNSRSINIFNLDTDTVQEVLATDRNDIWEPKWSPDGQKIAFILLGDQTSGIPVIDSSDVYVMNADGTNLHAVSAKWTDQLIGWATDNQHVLYMSIEPGSTTTSISIANVNDNVSIKISDERLDQVSIYPLAIIAQTSG
jgi:Tol biopolymer transport system component